MQCVTTPKIRLRFFMGEVRYTRIYGKKGTKLSKSKSEKLKGPWFPHKLCFLFSYFSFLNSLVPWFPQSLLLMIWSLWKSRINIIVFYSSISSLISTIHIPSKMLLLKCCSMRKSRNLQYQFFFRVWSLDFHIPSDNGSLTYLSSMWKSRNHQFTKI